MSESSATVINASTASPGICATYSPDANGYVPNDDCRSLWSYYPSFAAALVFALLFGMSNVIHILQAIRYRKRFCWVIIMAATWETVGFVLRTLSTRNQLSLGLFMPEELLILLAPLWVNAYDYMVLGRMVYYYLPEKKLLGIRAEKFGVCFVCLDIVAFIVQGVGGSMTSGGPGTDPDNIMLGIHVYMGGIGLQQCLILLFLGVAIAFHRRMLKGGEIITGAKPNWKPLLYTLYASLACITIRIIFRLIQYASGVNGALVTHESYFYCFEAMPMLLAIGLMNFVHPGRILVGPESEFPKLTKKEKREGKRRNKEEKQERKRKMELEMTGTKS